jgi:hypothetical protein
MPLFWPFPLAFLAGTAAAAGIGIVVISAQYSDLGPSCFFRQVRCLVHHFCDFDGRRILDVFLHPEDSSRQVGS